MNKQASTVNMSLVQFYDIAIDKVDELEESSLILELASIKERYESEEKIAFGGMKDILKSHDKLTGRTVAKGIIRHKKNHESIEKFIDEVRISASLEHPNIIPIYDLGLTEDNTPFFTMKLIEGDDLQVILDKINSNDQESISYYNRDRLLEIFLKVCDAIEYSHSKGVLHLDIKPSNIQVGVYGEVLVCDWGLARELTNLNGIGDNNNVNIYAGLDLSIDGKIKGSPGFMAPEQISGTIGPRSVKTDVYSLGCLLYSLLTLKKPINDAPLEDILKKTLMGEIEDVKLRNENIKIPIGLTAVVNKALNLSPDDRYSSVKELSDEIRSYKEGFATQAENAGLFQELYLLFGRHKTIFYLAIISLLLLAMSIIKVNNEKKAALMLNEKLTLEQEKTQKANVVAARYLLNSSIDRYYSDKFDQALKFALQAYKLDSTNKAIPRFLSYYLIGELRPDEALKYIARVNNNRKSWLLATANYLKSLKEDETISIDEVIAFRKYLSQFEPELRRKVLQHVNSKVTNTYDLVSRIKYAERSLSNKMKTSIKIIKLKDKYSLSLGEKANMVWDIDVITNLPITILDISNSKIRDLKPLLGMPLEEINLSYTPLLDLKFLEDSQLKKMNLTGSNIELLHYMPITIEELEIGTESFDYSGLLRFPKLKKVILPKKMASNEGLKVLKSKMKLVFKE